MQEPAPTPVAEEHAMASLVATSGMSGDQLARLDEISEDARTFLDAARSTNTHRAYHSDWHHFTNWCLDHNLLALPAAGFTLALYLGSRQYLRTTPAKAGGQCIAQRGIRPAGISQTTV
jgi:hypothetical protein